MGHRVRPRGAPDGRDKEKDKEVTAKQLAMQYRDLETEFNESFRGKSIGTICMEWPRIVPMLEKVEETAFRVLEKDFIFGSKNHMDQRIWQTGMYQFIETTRKTLKNHPEKKEPLGKFLEVILKRGRDYFEFLLVWIEKKFPITWSLTDGTATFQPQEGHPEAAGCALLCYSRTLIILGDAYRCSMVYPKNLQRAMVYYERARRMDPTRGRSFYQMGVVMKERGDVLSQAYDFTRALVAPVPVIEARERLVELYDNTYKLHKKLEDTFWYKKANKLETRDRAGVRKQVWLYSMGSDTEPALPEDPHTKDIHFQNMSPTEIYNRFALTFVNYVGKLFTQIGLDTIDEIAEEALVYFERLFQQDVGIQSLRLVQIMTLNMIIINRLTPPPPNVKVKGKQPVDFKLLTAVQFGMEMFGIMADRLARLVRCCDWDNKLMEPCCVGLEIWCSWMQLNPKVWISRRPRPRFCIQRLHNTRWQNKREPEDDVWIAFASLLTSLEPAMLKCSEMLFSSISTTRDDVHKVCLTPLPECMYLIELTCFNGSSLLEHAYYSTKTHNETRNQNYIRMKTIHRFGSHVLFSSDSKILGRQLKPDQMYTYTNLVRVRETERMEDLCGVTEDHYFFWTLNYNYVPPLREDIQIVRKPDCNNSRVVIRRKKKKNPNAIVTLPKRPRMPNYEVWLYLSDRCFRTEILVEPYRIVMDTNCLVRNLGYVRLLLRLIVRPIYLPVAVILELRGLSRGGFTKKDTRIYGSEDNPDAKDKLIENEETALKCRAALELISHNMGYFIIITSVGVILKVRTPYNYISDNIIDRTKTNDDRILDTCKYLESRDFEARSRDCPRRIYRKTLLVTGDRNLRIKCATMDIPTRPVSSVAYWFFCNHYPEQHAAILQKERDWREEHGYNRNRRGRRGRSRR